MILEAEADLVLMGPRSPLRSAQSRHPPDVLRSSLRSGRCRTDVPRMSCGLRSASVGAEQTSPGCLAPHLPQGFGCCGAGAHGSRSRLRLGRCRTDVPPPDVLQPVFRKASVVAWQAPVGPRSRLCTLSSALKWGKLNYTDFVQNCILDQKERTSL